jgi:tetratricopeptide (TPR) repeat protein
MSTTDHHRVKEIFWHAAELGAGEREAYLQEACGDDAALRREVASLLAHDPDRPDAFSEGRIEGVRNALEVVIESGSRGPEPPGGTAPAELPEQIGRYRIVRLIGEGGMGLVYEAEQDHPQRTVALKVIRPGLSSSGVLRRFRHEADVLGQLQHAGIAHIYDAGVADIVLSGGIKTRQPYFAMEFVRGAPVTEFAKRCALSTRRRMELIAKVCDALHHAHEKGVIHRDLKPANILVDDAGLPKILDFGVARLTDADIHTVTLHTAVGQLVGTVPYMSPEQVTGDSRQVDARSDVYAAGVVLYELLSGRLPHEVRGRPVPEAARIIRDEEPSRLSSLSPLFRGDVETIVAKAIEKDRLHRYASAAELAADIRRYLSDEPIVARPASTLYQFRKFARRNKAAVAGVAGVFLVLAAGIVVSASQAIRANRAETLALRRLDEAVAAKARAEQEQLEAERQARIAAAVNEFLNDDLLAYADPTRTADRNITVREVLDAAAKRIDSAFGGEPLVEAAIRTTLGHTYRSLGEFAAAEPQLVKAVEVRTRLLGESAPETVESLSKLGRLYSEWGRVDEATELLSNALTRSREIHGDGAPATARAMNDLAVQYNESGRPGEALELLNQALAIQRREFGDNHVDTVESLTNLAASYFYLGDYAKAEQIQRDALSAQRRLLGDEHPQTLMSVSNVAYFCESQGRFGEAEPLYEEALEVSRRVLGPEHRQTLLTMGNLGLLYASMGRLDEAEAVQSRTLELRRKALGPEHEHTLTAQGNLADVYAAQGRYEEAETLQLQTIAVLERTFGTDYSGTLATMNNLALIYQKTGAYEKAEALQRRVIDAQARTLGEEHPYTLLSMNNLSGTLINTGRFEDALPILEKLSPRAERVFAEDDPHIASIQWNYGRCLTALGRYEEAEPRLVRSEKILATADRSRRDRHQAVVRTMVELYERWNRPGAAQHWRTTLGDARPEP